MILVWNINFSGLFPLGGPCPWATLEAMHMLHMYNLWSLPPKNDPTEFDWNPPTGSEEENENVYFPPLLPPLNFHPL